MCYVYVLVCCLDIILLEFDSYKIINKLFVCLFVYECYFIFFLFNYC